MFRWSIQHRSPASAHTARVLLTTAGSCVVLGYLAILVSLTPDLSKQFLVRTTTLVHLARAAIDAVRGPDGLARHEFLYMLFAVPMLWSLFGKKVRPEVGLTTARTFWSAVATVIVFFNVPSIAVGVYWHWMKARFWFRADDVRAVHYGLQFVIWVGTFVCMKYLVRDRTRPAQAETFRVHGSAATVENASRGGHRPRVREVE